MYTTAILRMYADVGGVIVDIVNYQGSYAANEIPRAIAMLPVGWEVNTLLASTAHLLTTAGTIQIPTKVYLSVAYGAGDTSAILPLGDYLIFSGWTTGVGYRHESGSLRLAIELTHWLSALEYSSTLSATSHPKNPANFIFNAASDIVGGDGNLVGATEASKFFTAINLQTDLWGKCIYPWFLALAATDRIDVNKFGGVGAGNDSSTSDCATALGWFNPAVQDTPKLPFNTDGITAENPAHSISLDVSLGTLTPKDPQSHMKAMANTTFWSKLLSLAASYMFVVVPFPHKALVVPFIAGLQTYWNPTTYDFTIPARDMSLYEIHSNMTRPLRAFGLAAGHGCRNGALPDDGGDAVKHSIGGWHIAGDSGMVMIQDAPRWASEYQSPSIYAAESAAIDGDVLRSDSFNNPTAGAATTKMSPKAVKQEQPTLLDRLAHARYCTEILRLRTARISGPLRFDICPGSTVKLEGTAGAYGGSGEARYGSVHRVSYAINAQTAQVSTTFDMAHLRTQSENEAASTSVAEHPLYKEKWTGDYMLHAL